ncbi:MAG: hypothetical protein ACYCX2_10430 [Christensenellales bacterium]
MQCGCPHCGALMAQTMRGTESRCICPNCLHECIDCLGTRFSVTVKKGQQLPDELLSRFEELCFSEIEDDKT